MSGRVRRRVIVRGEVQGVWFRESTRQAAEKAGVGGWVRNLPDDTVEAALEGEAEAVEAVLSFCRVGPAAATVVGVEVIPEDPLDETSFVVRPTPASD